MEIIKVKDLTFTYPLGERAALHDISFSVEEGELLLICGTSGCGKSTLLRHLKPALTPHGKRSGEVLFSGKPIENLSKAEQAQRIGFVLQHPDDQIVTDKVWHELAFGCESLGMDQPTMRLRIGEMASYFGIQGWFYRSVEELSGGQKQLLNLASIMAMNPDILILDEPTSQLDPIAAGEFLATLKKLNRDMGITIILTEHRLEDAFSIADRVILMENGGVSICDTPKNVARLVREDSDMYYALPSSAVLHRGIGLDGECPLTVRDARAELNTLPLTQGVIKTNNVTVERGEQVLHISEGWFRYERNGEDILRGLELDAYAGEIFSIVGGNGTGKSTTLSIISGVNKLYRGSIRLYGKKEKSIMPREHRIAALPQDPRALFVTDTVEGELEEMLTHIKSKEEVKKSIDRIARQMDIVRLLGKHPFDLSGGEQQRVAMSKVLLTNPKILLLDEPTKGMDAHFKFGFGEQLKSLAAQGMAIIIVSHDIEFCAQYSHRCGLFFDGGIVAQGEPRQFFSGNHFYTTAANRIGRYLYPNVVLTRELVDIVKEQIKANGEKS